MAVQTTQARIEWIDAVRGLAIVLVVCYHGILIADAIGVAHPLWSKINTAVQTFRMPLFFFASGLLATSAIQRTWRQVAPSRIWLFVWLFTLWSVIETAFYALLPSVRPNRPPAQVLDLLTMYTVPDNGIWYLYALVLFFVTAKAARKIPSWVALGVAGAVSAVAASGIFAMNWVWQSMAMYAVFFLAGTRLSKQTFAWAAGRVSLLKATGLCVVTGASIALSAWADVFTVPGVRLVVSVLAVATGIAVCVWLCTKGWHGRLQWLGGQTLPIYVLHQMILNVLAIALVALLPHQIPLALGVIAPAVLIASGLALSLILAHPLQRIPGILSLPRFPRQSGLLAGESKSTVETAVR